VPAPVRLIVNPAAGGGRAGRAAPAVERRLSELGLDVRSASTRDLPHAAALALEAARGGEAVVALSGDGMVGVIADALRDVRGAVIGVLPGGRGNDLARVLGIPDDPLAACATIARGAARELDLGEVAPISGAGPAGRGRAFVGVASVGFDSDANRIANAAPARLGELVYAYGALRALAAWRPARFELQLDGEATCRAFTGFSVGAANSRSYGGGMRVAPNALLDDGQLEVMVAEQTSKVRFLTQLMPRVFKGTHVELPTVHVFRAAEVTIRADRPFTVYADGDPIAELPVRVRALPAAVRILVPAEAGADSPFRAPVASTFAQAPPGGGSPAGAGGAPGTG
jgi:YegS/Rv2252/BmrU family lipid kinase